MFKYFVLLLPSQRLTSSCSSFRGAHRQLGGHIRRRSRLDWVVDERLRNRTNASFACSKTIYVAPQADEFTSNAIRSCMTIYRDVVRGSPIGEHANQIFRLIALYAREYTDFILVLLLLLEGTLTHSWSVLSKYRYLLLYYI